MGPVINVTDVISGISVPIPPPESAEVGQSVGFGVSPLAAASGSTHLRDVIDG
jgi:hypothetical protein